MALACVFFVLLIITEAVAITIVTIRVVARLFLVRHLVFL
jgi:hypothetical protein